MNNLSNLSKNELRTMRGTDGQLLPEAQREMSIRGQRESTRKPKYVYSSIQGRFNQDALDMMPLITDAIEKADDFGVNQISCSAISAICNFSRTEGKVLDDMSAKEIKKVSEKMIEGYVREGWVESNV